MRHDLGVQSQAEHSPTPQLRLAVPKRLRLEGFIVSDHFDLMPGVRASRWPAGWRTGAIQIYQSVDEGIENAPAAFLKLFSGR